MKWEEKGNKTSYQIRTCTSEDLVCVESLPAVNTEDCLELCEGTIADVTKLASVREETVMDSFIREYQLYKHQQSDNLRQGEIILRILNSNQLLATTVDNKAGRVPTVAKERFKRF